MALEKGTSSPAEIDACVDEIRLERIDRLSLFEQYRLAPTPKTLDQVRGVHPRLYLDEDRIAALRVAVTGTHAPLWQELQALADRAVRGGPPIYREDDNWSGSEQLWQREVGNAMPVLAMAYVISGDRKYLEAAQAWALASCSYKTWGLGRIDGMDLAAGHQLFGLGIVYDWCYTALDHIVGDATEAYPSALGLERFHRHLLFLKPDVLIVADDIRLKEPKKLELRFHPEQQTGRPDGAAFLFEGKTAVLRFEPLTADAVEIEVASLAMEGRHGEKDLTMMTLRLTRTTDQWRNVVVLSWTPSDRTAAKMTSETHGDVTTFHIGGRSFSLDWANSAALTAVLFGVMVEAGHADSPEPTGVVFHQETLYRSDGKGDNWCITWAADDSQITSMDDGDWLNTGHYFHNHVYRILGGPDGFKRQDLPEYPDLSGEAGSWFGYGIISVDGILYSAISKTPGPRWSGPFRGIKLLQSGDNGSTWYRVDRQGRQRKIGRLDDARNEVNSEEMFFLQEFGLPHQSQVAFPFSYVNFVQHGRDNAAAKDNYVYIYSPEGAHSHKLLLARVEKEHLAVRNEWRYFVKFD